MIGKQFAKQLLRPLFEDEHYVFVHKPAGLAVHTPVSGGRWGVVETLEGLGVGSTDMRACYKLEKYTSGVLAIAKNALAAARFGSAMKQGQVNLTFAAVVRGKVKTAVGRQPVRRATSRRRQGRRPTGAATKEGVELVSQGDRRAVVRMRAKESIGTRVRAALRAQHLPVLGDARFDPRPGRSQSGRFFLHLEDVRFEHPVTGEAVRVRVPVPPTFEQAAMGESLLITHLETALYGRVPLVVDETTDAFRLFNEKVDGVPGLVIEMLGAVGVMHARQGKFDGGTEVLEAAGKWIERRLRAKAVYAKMIPKDRGRGGGEGPRGPKPAARIVRSGDDGVSAGEEIEIRERGVKYLVRPYDGYMVGLFLDHRDNRERLRQSAKGLRVLNLFSYTCGFSVAAAVGGAAATTNVDLSKKFLEWGKRNFEVNGLDLSDHRFYCCDTFEYFKRAERQAHRFDVIVLDPPTFSRTKKPARVFQVTKDMPRLISSALPLLESGGRMLLSTNHADLSARWLRECLKSAAGRRGFRVVETPPVPQDFVGARDAAKSVWVRFD